MSQRQPRRDEVWPSATSTIVRDVCGDRWRRRSLFSSERLDLILSNLRRNLGKSGYGNRCKPISHDPTYGSDVQRRRQQLLQQDAEGCGSSTSRRCGSTENATADDGGGDSSGDAAAVKSATELTTRQDHDDDEADCAARHRDLDAHPAVSAAGNQSDIGRVKMCPSLRAEPKRVSGNEADGSATSRTEFRSLPRRRQGTGEPQRQLDQALAFTVAPAPLSATSRDVGRVSRRDASLNDVLRDENRKRDGGSSKRSRSLGPGGRSELTTQGNSGVADQLKCNGSCGQHPMNGFLSGDSQWRHRPTSINWYVDLTDAAASTDFVPSPVSSSVNRQYRSDCRTESKAGPGKLEPEHCSTTEQENVSVRRGRAASTTTLEPPDGDAAKSLASVLDDLEERFTRLHRSLSLKQLGARSPAAPRTSTLRPSTNPHSEDPAFRRPSDSRCRRSMIVTRPRNSTFRNSVQPVPSQRDEPTRTRSVSVSERCRTLMGGNWFDNVPTSSAAGNRQKPTKNRDTHKPLTLSRELKPDFVIYV